MDFAYRAGCTFSIFFHLQKNLPVCLCVFVVVVKRFKREERQKLEEEELHSHHTVVCVLCF